MPQITLEYTSNISDAVDYHSLFHELHKMINNITEVKIDNCKSRARKIDCHFTGTGGQEKAFVHLDLYLLEGHPAEVKTVLGKEVLGLLKRHYSKSIEDLDFQITVRIGDILRDTYFKYPEGTFTQIKPKE